MRPSRARLRNFFCHGAKPMHLGDDVGRHEADIVPVQRILRSGISEADPDLHGTFPSRVAQSKRNRPPARERAASLFDSGGSYSALFVAALGSFAFVAFSAFFALGLVALGCRRGFVSFGLHRRRSDDGRDGEVAVVDRRRDALGQLDRADVDRIADVEPGDDRCGSRPGCSPRRRSVSSSWRTTLSTPPRLRPGESSSLSNRTGTATVTLVCSRNAQEIDVDRTAVDRVEMRRPWARSGAACRRRRPSRPSS